MDSDAVPLWQNPTPIITWKLLVICMSSQRDTPSRGKGGGGGGDSRQVRHFVIVGICSTESTGCEAAVARDRHPHCCKKSSMSCGLIYQWLHIGIESMLHISICCSCM